MLIVPLTLAADLPAGEHLLKAKVDWLECEETCIPGEAEVSGKLIVGTEAKPGWEDMTGVRVRVNGVLQWEHYEHVDHVDRERVNAPRANWWQHSAPAAHQRAARHPE